jgi:hypothetical protein
MFKELQAASPLNKYKVAWVELAPVQFQAEIPKWLSQLNKSVITGGPSASHRQGLATEFLRLLYIQQQVLNKQSRSVEAQRAKTNIDWFVAEYKRKFNVTLKAPDTSDAELDKLIDRQAVIRAKLKMLDEKLQLVNFWNRSLTNFPEHKEGQSLTFQYMGNAPTSKVRTFLEVLCSDGAKAVKLDDKAFKTSYATQLGLQTERKVEWTDDRFRKAVKAEVGASYGAKLEGTAELEFKNIKAKLDASAWAGMAAKAKGEVRVTGKQVAASGSVDAEIAVRLKANLNIDCADIFVIEASAEAFAGAMLHGEFEIEVAVGGVKVKAGAEVFVGAKLTGEASGTFKLAGYEILKADATAALTAGAGAKFALEFQSSFFDGSSFSIESGLTVGTGAETGTKLKFNAGNLALAMHSLYYTAYLEKMEGKQSAYTYKEYFRTLEDNGKLFVKARGIIEDQMRTVIMEQTRVFSEFSAYRQLEGLAVLRATGAVV